jgi:hypothetical protein
MLDRGSVGRGGDQGERPATGVLGGILHGAIIGVLFGGVAGAVMVAPMQFKYPDEDTPYALIALINGMIFGLPGGVVWGAVVGFINRRTKGAPYSGLAAGSGLSLLLGVVGAAVLMWHRLDLDSHMRSSRSSAVYVYLVAVLITLIPLFFLILGSVLGSAIGFVIRMRAGFFLRALTDIIAGVLGGLVAGLAAMILCWFILGPLIEGYGGW